MPVANSMASIPNDQISALVSMNERTSDGGDERTNGERDRQSTVARWLEERGKGSVRVMRRKDGVLVVPSPREPS